MLPRTKPEHSIIIMVMDTDIMAVTTVMVTAATDVGAAGFRSASTEATAVMDMVDIQVAIAMATVHECMAVPTTAADTMEAAAADTDPG